VDLPTALRLHLDAPTRAEVGDLADAFLRHHTEDAFPDRVRRVAHQMESTLPAPQADSSPGQT
jgi:hypothetical protein